MQGSFPNAPSKWTSLVQVELVDLAAAAAAAAAEAAAIEAVIAAEALAAVYKVREDAAREATKVMGWGIEG